MVAPETVEAPHDKLIWLQLAGTAFRLVGTLGPEAAIAENPARAVEKRIAWRSLEERPPSVKSPFTFLCDVGKGVEVERETPAEIWNFMPYILINTD